MDNFYWYKQITLHHYIHMLRGSTFATVKEAGGKYTCRGVTYDSLAEAKKAVEKEAEAREAL